MKNIVLIAGYIRSTHLRIIREYFGDEQVCFAIAYKRPPDSPTKQRCLGRVDLTFNLTEASDIEALRNASDDILLVTHTLEYDVETYIDVLKLLGRITTTQEKLYRKLVHKHAFKEEMRAAALDIVPSCRLLTDANIETLAEELTYPQVIKPTGLSGSLFVKVVHDSGTLLDFYNTFKEHMRRRGREHYEKEIEAIAESFLVGPQYSVNAYVDADGHLTLCPVLRVVPANELGIDDTYSALQHTQNELTDADLAALKETLSEIVKHFQVKCTSMHFDVAYTDAGWRVFEVGLRIGGNRQDFFERSHQMNHLHNDVANRLGRKVVIPKLHQHVAIVQKGAATRGTLKSIDVKDSESFPASVTIEQKKTKKAGLAVRPVSEGGVLLIRFFVTGQDLETVQKTSATLFENIQFSIE